MTVHNMAFPGKAPRGMLGRLFLPPQAFAMEGVEFYGEISLLKAGLQFADRITTVSPSYAAEIQTPEFGMGFDGLLRARAAVVSGILNGIDTEVWNPATDRLLAETYAGPEGKGANKRALQREMGLAEDAAVPLFAVISRLTDQKGCDVLLRCLAGLPGQIAVLGTGEARFEAGFRAARSDRVGVVIGYDEGLAHRMQAGADVLLVPSRFEPCGLTQLCALRYGAVPVVSRTGGLADTVIDANPAALAAGVATGVQFAPLTEAALGGAVRQAAALYGQPAVWRRMQANAMAADVSWRGPARAYAALFRSLL
jgi:starch synthase